MQKRKSMLKIKFVVFLTAVALILIMALFYPYYKPRNVIWCYYQQNVTESLVPRHECVYTKIISNDVKEINLEQFRTFNISDVGCFDSYDKLPSCSGNDFYFAQFDLNRFAKDFTQEKMDGTLCIAYHITFYKSNDTDAEYYRGIYEMQDFKTEMIQSELKEKMISCRVE